MSFPAGLRDHAKPNEHGLRIRSGAAAPGLRVSGEILQLTFGTPSFGVCFADNFRIWYGADDHSDFGLTVPFDSRLFRAAVFFTPDERELSANLDIGIHHAE